MSSGIVVPSCAPQLVALTTRVAARETGNIPGKADMRRPLGFDLRYALRVGACPSLQREVIVDRRDW